MDAIRKVGVLGCGLMGSGIAEACATAGYATVVRELTDELSARGRASIEKSLGRAVERGKRTAEERDAALRRLSFATRLEDLRDCDLIIEAVVEDLKTKVEMFQALDAITPPRTLFASNTSSISITEMAAATRRADRMLGLHFFNPVPVMKLVEVIRTVLTSEETFETAMAFVRSLGKDPVVCRDTPGFLANRLLVPYLLDSIRALESGVATVTDLDKTMVLGCGHPMGPFTLADFVGIDTLYRIAEVMYNEFRDPRYAAPPLLKQMVLAGYVGKKTGKGFYDYSGEAPVPTRLGL
ncbi:MAG: 3-hydroxybutyryl-CoA dehydrogenase [Gemmatimonadetes bacterium]|nr:3-hydroxybutyryl-CoA dehydrogenase [Gemmatimonadota bacterium]